MTEAGEQDLTCSGEKQFCSLFKHLKLRREPEEKAGRELDAGVSSLRPSGHMQPGMAVNAAQHKIVNLFNTL